MGGGDGHGHGDHGGKKYSIPESFKKEHEHRGYAGKNEWTTEAQPNPFWHPPPKDMPDAPVHFHNNAVDLEIYLGDPRQRLAGMTDAERAWRKKYVLGQNLTADEPNYVPEFHGNFNPIRRIYRIPWDWVERRYLIPVMGYAEGHIARAIAPKLLMGLVGLSWIYYHMKYFNPTWLDHKRARVVLFRTPSYRDEETEANHPGLIDKVWKQYKDKQDYHDFDFKVRTAYLNLDPPNRP